MSKLASSRVSFYEGNFREGEGRGEEGGERRGRGDGEEGEETEEEWRKKTVVKNMPTPITQ